MMDDPETTPTLAELSLKYRLPPPPRPLSEWELEIVPEYLEQMARDNPVPAIRMALILDPLFKHFIFMDKIVAPYASDIPDDDLDLLREATAYIAGKAIAYWSYFPISDKLEPQDYTILQALGFLFKKLFRSEGQTEEVRELADSVWKACAHHPHPKALAGIMPFTTKGMGGNGPDPLDKPRP